MLNPIQNGSKMNDCNRNNFKNINLILSTIAQNEDQESDMRIQNIGILEITGEM